MIQKALSYPELQPLTDSDVRVAYTCKLIRRSIVNYAAFEAYFQSNKDSASVWSAITPLDWILAAEMEAATLYIANLALVESQSESLVSSYMVVFRRLAEKRLKSFKFQMMVIEAPKAKDENETTHRRVERTLDQFSEQGKICLRRTLLQLQARFPKVTKESMACVLLDPRTKHAAKKIAAVGNVSRKEEKAIYTSGLDYLRQEHRNVFGTMTKEKKIPLNQDFSSENSSAFSQETSPFSSPASTGWDDEEDLLFGAPIRTNQTREEVKEQEVDARADRVLTEWLELEPDWLDVADCQNPSKSREELRKEMCIANDKGSYWSLLDLYRHVDVLRWFRDEGEDRFPSIALLARIHLGKVSSSAFQERVFSSGGIVMGPLRTRTDHRRAEKQLLLRHNRNELLKLKQDAKKAKEQKET
ncbi:Cysteine synthase [Phytophthora nicotianae]|uniref:Cysteine synthase n=1 Tax=Phytophthora nicotianae TaxID=4792 RepID=A0A0W8DHT2_PHYNI|nr:Cysteine synthase [Phytophthora nicotianae]